MHLGDYGFGSTVFFPFTTVNSSGVPTALSSGGVTVYRNASTVQDATGVTLVASFDTVTGLNHVTIEMSTAGFYSSAGSYFAIISSGAASEDLSGYELATWSLRRFTPFSTAGLETLSSAGLETLSSAGLETASSLVNVREWGGSTVLGTAGGPSTAGLETLSSAGLETLSSAGLETLSSAGLETLSSAGLETASSAVNVTEIAGVAAPANVLSNWLNQGVNRTADSGSTVTLVDAANTEGEDFWLGALLAFRSGTNDGRIAIVSSFAAVSNTIRFAPETTAAVTTEDYTLVPGLGLTLLSTAGLETLSTAGIETLSSAGLETASSLVDMVNMTTAAAIQVNAEVVDGLATDTTGLVTGAPPASASIEAKIGVMYGTLLHGMRLTSSGKTFLTDSSGVAWVKGLIDDGTTYVELLGTTST